jgi:hypothetical protein
MAREEEISASDELDNILNGNFEFEETEDDNEEYESEEEDDIEDTDENSYEDEDEDTNDQDADSDDETSDKTDEDSIEEDAQEDGEESNKDESEDEESEDGADDESEEKSDEGEEDNENGLENTDSNTNAETNEPNVDFYKSFYEKVTSTEFKANGKTVKGFTDPDKIIKAQQMLYGFENKMAGFKKYRPLLSALDKSGMIENHDKFNLMMDVMNGDREALKHFISINKVDPIVDLDLDDIKYTGANYVETDEAINIKETLERAREVGVEDKFRTVVGSEWDTDSFKEFSAKPQVREDLLYHMTNKLDNDDNSPTIYDAVQDKIRELRLLDTSGRFSSKNSINQYREAVAVLAEERKSIAEKAAEQHQKNKPAEAQEAAPKVVDKSKVEAEKAKILEKRQKEEYAAKVKAEQAKVAEKRKKASSVSTSKPKVTTKEPKFDPLKLTGKDFFEVFDMIGKS